MSHIGDIVYNQLGPFFGPIPHGNVPYPQQRNIVDKGYADFITTKMRKKIFRVPNGTVDTGSTRIELPEPFLRGSVLCFRNGVLENLTSFIELNNLEVQLPNAPATGANRELIEFEYLPASLIGRNAFKYKMTFTFSASRTLTFAMLLYSYIRVLSTSAVTLTLPTLTAAENGARVTFLRDGVSSVLIAPPGGTTLDNSSDPYTIGTTNSAVEFIYQHSALRWNRIGRES